jgi:hypothetical protein
MHRKPNPVAYFQDRPERIEALIDELGRSQTDSDHLRRLVANMRRRAPDMVDAVADASGIRLAALGIDGDESSGAQ